MLVAIGAKEIGKRSLMGHFTTADVNKRMTIGRPSVTKNDISSFE